MLATTTVGLVHGKPPSTIFVWSVKSTPWEPFYSLVGSTPPDRPCVSPDRRLVASVFTDRQQIAVWDVATGGFSGPPIHVGSEETIEFFTFSPDSRVLSIDTINTTGRSSKPLSRRGSLHVHRIGKL